MQIEHVNEPYRGTSTRVVGARFTHPDGSCTEHLDLFDPRDLFRPGIEDALFQHAKRKVKEMLARQHSPGYQPGNPERYPQ